MTVAAGLPRRVTFLRAAPVALTLLTWRFAWDNARTMGGLPLGPVLSIPRSVRLVEMGLIGALVLLSLTRLSRSSRARVAGATMVLCVVILGVTSAAVAIVSGYAYATDALQMVYVYAVPLLVCVAVAALDRGREDAERVLRWFVAGVSVNAIAGWYQFGMLGRFGDDVHGVMRDAHHFASAVWLCALWFVARLASGHGSRTAALVGLAVVVPVGFAAANEKAAAAFAATLLAGLAWALWRRGWMWRVVVLALFVGVGIGIAGVAAGNVELPASMARYQFVVQNIQSVGLVEGYRKLGTVIRENPRTLVLGAGPGSYGSVKALDRVTLGGELPPLAERYSAASYRVGFLSLGAVGSYVEESTDVSALLVEFGPLATLLLVATAWVLLVVPAREAARSDAPAMRAIGRWLRLGALYVLLISTVTAFYGWSSIEVTTWTLALVAALVPVAAAGTPFDATASEA